MRNFLALSLVSLAACGGGSSSSVDGPLKLGVISGQNQVVTAGAAQLPNPVVGKLVHANTSTGFRFELVKTAYAQTGPTVVTGSPVVGAVVCAVSPVAGSMIPFVPCTNTASDGTAIFYFDPGKKAGAQISEIRGLLNGQPAVFDTAHATVNPGAADPNFHTGPFPILPAPYVLPALAVIDGYGNAVPYRVVSDANITAADTTTGSVGARTLSWTVPQANKQDLIAELRSAGVVVAHIRYTLAASGTLSVSAITGINLAP